MWLRQVANVRVCQELSLFFDGTGTIDTIYKMISSVHYHINYFSQKATDAQLNHTWTAGIIGLQPNFKRALFKIFAAPLCK